MKMPTFLVVGSGPAGCYTAQALRKEIPTAQITVMERLPVPYGLLRYGVAADHQGTKGVQSQFEQMFTRSDVDFVGCVEVGRDVALDHLLELFDVVVMATGLADDRSLGVAGELLEGVIGAGRLTRALNSHPEETPHLPTIGPRVAIIGSGNVAVDVLRLISKSGAEWDNSDMDAEILSAIRPVPVSEVHLVARASANAARWDAAMVKELAGVNALGFHIAGGPAGAETAVGRALADLVDRKPAGGCKTVVSLHFNAKVDEIIGDGTVSSIRIARIDRTVEVPVDTVVTAIGFENRVTESRHRVYTSGWLKTGPRGTIPSQRTLAKQVVAEIAEDLRLGRIDTGRAGRSGLQIDGTTDFRGWTAIDRHERAMASESRTRRKVTALENMRALALNGNGEAASEEIAS